MSSQDHRPQPATPRDPASSPSVEWTDASRRSAKGGGEHPLSFLRSPFSIGNNLGVYLQNYFRSGWAFFIPYLAAYLLYAWLRWPVNPVVEGAGSREQGAGGWVPSLLHVYWVLHAVHLVLGAFAIRSWRRQTSLLHSHFSLFLKAAPWLLLALLFYIPGIYLEWPSDPWEHLRRINEWRILDQVTAHSSWKKSSYFLPYSLTQHVTGLTQLSWLNVYYTAVCLLLSWQYYRLARAVGLGERASFIFVLIVALTFGNNVFSFYRYYGLSSSILAQLGAIALTRIALEALRPAASSFSEDGYSLTAYRLSLIASAPALLALTASNHTQGLGIAGLGIMAVVVWRLIEWKRSMLAWLAGTVLLASVAVALWLPRHPAIEEMYRAQGWLAPWYGFNLFSAASPALERSMHILGTVGLANAAAALLLIASRNSIVGWLTLLPVMALTLPCIALPFANWLAANGSAGSIVVFHRILFAGPIGLALVALTSAWCKGRHLPANEAPPGSDAPPGIPLPIRNMIGPGLLIGALFMSMVLTPGAGAYNRMWHGLQVTPADLRLHGLASAATRGHPAPLTDPSSLIFAPPQPAQALNAFLAGGFKSVFRSPNRFSNVRPEEVTHWLESVDSMLALVSGPELRATAFQLAPGWLLMEIPQRARDKDSQVMDLTAPNTEWLDAADPMAPIYRASASSTLDSNAGQPMHLFSSAPIPVEHGKRYRASTAIRQTEGSRSINYLAIAWLNRSGQLLHSNLPTPDGAGSPEGWNNGTYSYYGLVGQPASGAWQHYSVSFGLGESAAIPGNAAYMRVGAILNFTGAESARLSLKEVMVEELPSYTSVRMILPAPLDTFTPSSAAARLSGHWRPQQFQDENAGRQELMLPISGGKQP